MNGKRYAALLLALLMLVCAGCAADTEKEDGQQGLAEKRFLFVCPIIENEYWEECIAGIRKADEELGTHTEVVGPKTADNFVVEIVDYMRDAVAARPDGIIGYLGIPDMARYIDEAGEAGIPVIAIDSDNPETSRKAYVGTNLYNFGYEAGRQTVQLTGGKGKIGCLCSAYDIEGETVCYAAFQDAIADYDMEIVAREEGKADPETAAEAVRAMLKEHPDITAVFCSGGYNAAGAARVKAEEGLDFALVGFDDVPENLDFVRKGVIDALLVQSPYLMGYQGVYVLKECVDKGVLSQDSYDTGSILVTKENVDTYK